MSHIERLSEGLSNFNYKVRLDSGAESFVLRIYKRDPQACQKEADLLHFLKHKVSVHELIHVQPNGGRGIAPFTITRYIEGISFRELKRTGDSEAIAQAAYSVGETLAALRSIDVSSLQPVSAGAGSAIGAHSLNMSSTIPEFIDTCLNSQTLHQHLDANARERVHDLTWSRFQDLAALQQERHLVHGDLNNRNVIVQCQRDRWAVAGIIDWELTASGSPLYDISTFLQYERECEPSREPHFSLGYMDAGGELPERWRQLARIVGFASQCEALSKTTLPGPFALEIAELVRQAIAEENG